jgi:hypothetical protein
MYIWKMIQDRGRDFVVSSRGKQALLPGIQRTNDSEFIADR